MMRKVFNICLIVFAILFLSCSGEKEKERSINGSEINKQLISFFQGDSTSIKLFSFLDYEIDPKLIPLQSIGIDSILANNSTKLYSVIVESELPVFNRLFFVDEELNLLMIDKSINGNLDFSWLVDSVRIIGVLQEKFNSKQTLGLTRTSLYLFDGSNIDLVFRDLTGLSYKGKSVDSKIEFLSDSRLILRTFSNDFPKLKNVEIKYNFGKLSKRFVSLENPIKTTALELITKIDGNNNLIKDEASIQEITNSLVSNQLSLTDGYNYSLSVNNEWAKIENVSIANHLLVELKGIQYINNKIGAVLSVIKIHSDNNAEDFTDHKLNADKKKKNFRSSETFEQGKIVYKIFEYSCNNEKYILIFEGPKFTYDNYSSSLEKLVYSFEVDC